MSVKNLKYLTIRQALLDIRYFIIKKKRTRAFGKRKWIVFGSSYSGLNNFGVYSKTLIKIKK